MAQQAKFIEMLERRDIITTDPGEADECCGLPRDEDGFCIHRPGHPIYFDNEMEYNSIPQIYIPLED